MIGDVRRRVTFERYGRRGRATVLEYTIKGLLLRGQEKLTKRARHKLLCALGDLGDGGRQIGAAWRAKELVRDLLPPGTGLVVQDHAHHQVQRRHDDPPSSSSRRPIARLLTGGQRGDAPQFIAVMDTIKVARRGPGRPRTRPGRAMGEKAYSSRAIRSYLRRHGIKTVIPVKEDQKKHRLARGRAGGRPPAFDTEHYKQRNTVERCFSKLEQFRAVATRYDKRARIYQGT